ncbi:MAG: LOG family protein [Candidatus Daviesbacteria bacterium]|nr:LOG family protein [Candidatus Daviesbacteria bacterium]
MEPLIKVWKKITKDSLPEKAESIEQVAIFGSAEASPESKLFKETFAVAEALAKSGYTVVDGGGPGVMRAASLGAKAGGGKVIGVTLYPEDCKNFEGRDSENPIDKEIKTETYVERTLTLMSEGQVYVIFNGASGTMSEFAMAWGLARLHFGHHKPLILYGKFWKQVMKVLRKHLVLRPEEIKVYKIVDSPRGVLQAIKQFEEEIKEGRHQHLQTS